MFILFISDCMHMFHHTNLEFKKILLYFEVIGEKDASIIAPGP